MPEYMCPHCHAVFREHKPNCPNDGSILIEVPVLTDLSGKVLRQKYRLDEALGHGGFGSVYKATHLVLGKLVAVKVLRAEFRNDSTMVARFFNEARVVTRLTNPHTINTFDLDQAEEGFLFMVMDYVEGQTLRQLARQEGSPPGRLPWQRTLKLLVQVCDALEEAHKAGVVHRDLKPDNIMISNRGGQADYVTVLDFGIAKVVEGTDMQNLTAAGMLLGSPAYMSPEQVRGGTIGPLSDIYSLGVIAYQVLSGLLPINAKQTAAMLQEKMLNRPEPLTRKVPDLQLPLELEHLVMTMLELEEAQRPQTAGEVRDIFVRLLREEGGAEAGSLAGVPLQAPPQAGVDGTRGYAEPFSARAGAAPGKVPESAPSEPARAADMGLEPTLVPDAAAPALPGDGSEDATRVPGIVTRPAGPGRRVIGGAAIFAGLLVAVAIALAIGLGLKEKDDAGASKAPAVATAQPDAVAAKPAGIPAEKPPRPEPPEAERNPARHAPDASAVQAPPPAEEKDVVEVRDVVAPEIQPTPDLVTDVVPVPETVAADVVESPPVSPAEKLPAEGKTEKHPPAPNVPEVPTEKPSPAEKTVVPKEKPTPAEKTEVPKEKPAPEEKTEVPKEKPAPVEKTEVRKEKPAPVEKTEVPKEKPAPAEKPSPVEDLEKAQKKVDKELKEEMKALQKDLGMEPGKGVEGHIDKAFKELDDEMDEMDDEMDDGGW